ncbi:hypothetical protein FOL47_003534 [Perkinsus chesapeaki]|uniref:Rhodanese domain-containing protein n=1 Tax=Perkinsus chesapeaki TaxID=330153 RepID=A0A7J6MZP7_PERCH|nr:hypothetical protein FOL47_003534 [Perkinsus chesapeaki]
MLSSTVGVTLLFSIFLSLVSAADVVKVLPEKYYTDVSNDDIFVCPPEVIPEGAMSDWKNGKDAFLNVSQCEDYDEFLAEDNQKDVLDCIVWIEGQTIAALEKLGVDAYLMSGSLLGWYRHHQGVIPWDVDGDLGMHQDKCNAAFEAKGAGKHKNMIGLLRETLGGDFYVGARLQGVGSSLPEDSFDACNTNELMVRGPHPNGKTCHTDIWIMHPDEPEYKGTEFECKCEDSIAKPRVCRKGTICNALDDFLPAQKSTQTAFTLSADIKVPNKPKKVLDLLYRNTDFMNMASIPANYKFSSRTLVLGSDVSSITHKDPQLAVYTQVADTATGQQKGLGALPEVSIVIILTIFMLGMGLGVVIHKWYARRHSPTISYSTIEGDNGGTSQV